MALEPDNTTAAVKELLEDFCSEKKFRSLVGRYKTLNISAEKYREIIDELVDTFKEHLLFHSGESMGRRTEEELEEHSDGEC
jgi:ADP-heptose:LPS heptosyltransferase